MLRITHGEVDGQQVTTDFDTNAVEIIDGCLVVYADTAASRTLAGYAPGAWAAFEIVPDDGDPQ